MIIHRLTPSEQAQVTALADKLQGVIETHEYTDKVVIAALLSVTVSVMTVIGIGLSAAIENIRLRFGATNGIPRPDNGNETPDRSLN